MRERERESRERSCQLSGQTATGEYRMQTTIRPFAPPLSLTCPAPLTNTRRSIPYKYQTSDSPSLHSFPPPPPSWAWLLCTGELSHYVPATVWPNRPKGNSKCQLHTEPRRSGKRASSEHKHAQAVRMDPAVPFEPLRPHTCADHSPQLASQG